MFNKNEKRYHGRGPTTDLTVMMSTDAARRMDLCRGGRQVRIFWDLENIRCPTDKLAQKQKQIIRYFQQFGEISSFQIFAKQSHYKGSIPYGLAEYCFPRDPRAKNSTDTRLITELLISFMTNKDNRRKQMFVVISNDYDFCDALEYIVRTGKEVYRVVNGQYKKSTLPELNWRTCFEETPQDQSEILSSARVAAIAAKIEVMMAQGQPLWMPLILEITGLSEEDTEVCELAAAKVGAVLLDPEPIMKKDWASSHYQMVEEISAEREISIASFLGKFKEQGFTDVIAIKILQGMAESGMVELTKRGVEFSYRLCLQETKSPDPSEITDLVVQKIRDMGISIPQPQQEEIVVDPYKWCTPEERDLKKDLYNMSPESMRRAHARREEEIAESFRQQQAKRSALSEIITVGVREGFVGGYYDEFVETNSPAFNLAKMRLQKYFQVHLKKVPVYHHDKYGSDNNCVFDCYCKVEYLNKFFIAKGRHLTKKAAEKVCARVALDKLIDIGFDV